MGRGAGQVSKGGARRAAASLAVPLLVGAWVIALMAGIDLLVASGVTTAALVGVGVWWRCPVNAGVWWALAAVMVCWATAMEAQRRGETVASQVALTLCLVVAAVLVTVLMRWVTRARVRPDLYDVAATGLLLGLAAAQVGVLAGAGRPVAALASVQVVVAAFVLRLALTRKTLQPAWVVLVVGASVMCAGSMLREAVTHPPAADVATAAGCLAFGVAALLPSAATTMTPEALVERAVGSKVVLAVLPLVAAPAGLWLVDQGLGGGQMPLAAHVLVSCASAVTAVLRAHAATRRLEWQAEHDPLTDLPNRRGLARLHAQGPPPPRHPRRRATRHSTPPAPRGWSLLMVDLDDFKDVNDTHGHDAGDQLLRQVTARLVTAVAVDGTVARLGGDEFAVLVRPGCERAVADRVVQVMREPFDLGVAQPRCTASVGVATPADSPATNTATATASATRSEMAAGAGALAGLLMCADVALYTAKAAGRDTWRAYDPAQRDAAVDRVDLTGQVRHLLAGRSSEVGRLEMHYQPLVELVNGEVVGAEALVRWRHPSRGLLAPDAFLQHVRASGMDAALDAAVLADVVEQMGRWRDQGRRALPVSVNLTRAGLLDPTLVDRLVDGLTRAGVDPTQLRVEITEHEPLPDDTALAQNLHHLAGMGVEVHLDDYGTGYTSLDYLTRFPVRLLKVDRTVVQGLSNGSTVMAGVAAMTGSMDLDVVAEGVETTAQRDHLVAMGIRYGQGWLFAKAMPAQHYADTVLGPGWATGQTPPAAPPAQLVTQHRPDDLLDEPIVA